MIKQSVLRIFDEYSSARNEEFSRLYPAAHWENYAQPVLETWRPAYEEGI